MIDVYYTISYIGCINVVIPIANEAHKREQIAETQTVVLKTDEHNLRSFILLTQS